MLASRERQEASVALSSTLHGLNRAPLPEERNDQGVTRLNADLAPHETTRRVPLDIASPESPVHAAQEQAAYHVHFESVCYHPPFVFSQNALPLTPASKRLST